jgi:hypothetical protein
MVLFLTSSGRFSQPLKRATFIVKLAYLIGWRHRAPAPMPTSQNSRLVTGLSTFVIELDRACTTQYVKESKCQQHFNHDL